MTLAYRIVNWRKLYEVTGRGKPAGAETPVEEMRKSPLPYVRWSVHGHSLGPTYRKMVKKAWGVGILMEMACMGLFGKLLELAADQGPQWRGWILDEKQRPINAQQIADILDIKDDGKVESLLEILCHEEINWVELVEFPLQVGASRGESGKEGERRGEEGKVEDSLYKVTEAVQGTASLNETERDSPTSRGESGGVSPAPPSSLVAGSVTEVTVSASDSATRGVQGIKKRRAQAFLQFSQIIPTRDSSDQTTFRDIFEHIEHRMIYDTEEPLFDMAIEKAKECYRGRVPAAMFTAAMKKAPFYYIPKGTRVIRK